jgi:hypothetical protein
MTSATKRDRPSPKWQMNMDNDMYMIDLVTLIERQNDYDRRENREGASVMGGAS